MSTTITIGRKGNQPFPIQKEAVSQEHARLTIDDTGQWTLEDLNSTNGTYVRNDETGDFERIARKQIQEDTVIRLGNGGRFNEQVFMAHHLLEKNPDEYGWELNHVIQLYETRIKTALDALYAKNSKREVFSIIGTIGGLALSFLVKDLMLMRLCMALPPLIVTLLFMGTGGKMKKVQELRNKIIVCPKCNRQLSDQEIKDRCCAKCQAHT